jgi:hypothetical protein
MWLLLGPQLVVARADVRDTDVDTGPRGWYGKTCGKYCRESTAGNLEMKQPLTCKVKSKNDLGLYSDFVALGHARLHSWFCASSSRRVGVLSS